MASDMNVLPPTSRQFTSQYSFRIGFGPSSCQFCGEGVALFGMSATFLGNFGTSIGWGLFQIFMIMTATLSGVFTGEWESAPSLVRTLLVITLPVSAAQQLFWHWRIAEWIEAS